MRWDLYCRVIDNHGDLGVCWRLARELAGRGEAVRLWVDEPAALAWMAPQARRPVAPGEASPCPAEGEVLPLHWDPARGDGGHPAALQHLPDVLVEAFGCEPPPALLQACPRDPGPLWINLEYLSAEAYVERSHALRSPQSAGPGAGLDKWFYYPGFTDRTGGLLREAGVLEAARTIDGEAWRAARGWARRPGEAVVTLFCYDNPALPALLQRFGEVPTLLLLTPGPATLQWRALGAAERPASVRAIELPWLTQPDYDRLLASADLNFVRGEDSFVRAQWAQRPFVWQIYPQHDGAHRPKLEAFLDRWLAEVPAAQARCWREAWRAWNGLAPLEGLAALPHPADPADALAQAAARAHAQRWAADQAGRDDLVTQLLAFVAHHRPGRSGATPPG